MAERPGFPSLPLYSLLLQTDPPHRSRRNVGHGAARAKTSGVATVLRVTSGNFLETLHFFLFGFYAMDISKAFDAGE
jgi:hypothetical protein